MIRDNGIISVWCKTFEEFRDEFVSEFNDLNTSYSDNTSVTSFVLCQYHNQSVYAEVVYSIIINDIVYFALNTAQYELSLDSQFKVSSFHTNDDCAYIFISSLFEFEYVNYLQDICCESGNMYSVFSLNKESQINRIKELDNIPIDYIDVISDDLVMNICVDFMEYTSNSFTNLINMAKMQDEPYDGIDENPFQDKFYDRYDDTTVEAPHVL